MNINAVQDVKGQIDKRNIYLLLGCYCNEPKTMLNNKTQTKHEDYPEVFHATIFGAMLNIVHKGNINKISPIDIENEISQFPKALEVWKLNKGFEYIENAIEDTKELGLNIESYRDTVRKYSILRHATQDLKIDLSSIYDENDDNILSKFNAIKSMDLITIINNKIMDFKEIWQDNFGENKSFKIGDGLKKLITKYQTEESCGYPFQSKLLTSAFNGMLNKNYTIVSSKSGGGKSRIAIAEALNLSSLGYYEWKTKKWISTGEKLPVLYISTELLDEEIQLCALAHVSGISPKRIKEWQFNSCELDILNKSTSIIENSNLYCEYLPDFTIDSISNTIEKYILNHNVQYVFFDYINETPSLYQYYYEKTHSCLRTDQILYMFSETLKRLVNKYNIFLYTSTQLNRGYKEDDNKDSSALKGSNSVPEKADNCCIMLPINNKERKTIEPIINRLKMQNPNFIEPNTIFHIYKTRGGKYNNIKIFVYIDLGCIRIIDCFATNNNYEYIEVDFKDFDFGEIDFTQLNNNIEDNEIIS